MICYKHFGHSFIMCTKSLALKCTFKPNTRSVCDKATVHVTLSKFFFFFVRALMRSLKKINSHCYHYALNERDKFYMRLIYIGPKRGYLYQKLELQALFTQIHK